MSTLIELYDKESVLNIIAACAFTPTPDNVVFVGEFRDSKKVKRLQSWLEVFLNGRGLSPSIVFKNANMQDHSQIIDALVDIQNEYSDCVLEVSGGNDLALLAAGMFAEKADIPIFRFVPEKQCFADVRDMTSAEHFEVPAFSAEEIFSLARAGVVGHGHFDSDELSLSVRSDAREIWYIFLAHRARWHQIVGFFQTARCEEGNELAVNCNGTNSGFSISERNNIAKQLAAAGLLENLVIRENRITFTYKNELIKSILQDAGAALEIFVYSCIRRNPDIFNDCEINLCVDWDGVGPSQTRNEIDIVAVSDAAPIFISCKSGKMENVHLNEVFAITKRLGGLLASAAIVTADTTKGEHFAWLRQRASDMGIALININDLCDRIHRRNYSGINDCRMCYTRECERNLTERLAALCGKKITK